jgi:hypothetical protein
MEMYCADCGCLVERGVRVAPCGKSDCCCLDLPVRGSIDAIAAEIQAAFASKDLSRFGVLLADDARWGDDDALNKCRSRGDVIATFERLLAEGVDGGVIDTTTGPGGVMCQLRVDWPNPADRSRGEVFFHVYLVRDGHITEIRRYDDRDSATEVLNAP